MPPQPPAGRGIGKDQRGRVLVALAGDDDVLHEIGREGEKPRAERPDAHPRAGRELEVLGDPALEDESGVRPRRIGEGERIAESIEPFLVERGGGQRRVAPVAGRHVRAAHPPLEPARDRRELELDARRRDADARRGRHLRAGADRKRRRFGRAETGHPDDALAAGVDGERLDFVGDLLAQRRRGVEEHPQAAEKMAAKAFVVAQDRQQHLVAARHVVVHGRRDLPQVGNRGLEQPWRRFAGVEIERTAVVERDAGVVISAEGVIPRQPVTQHRRLVAQKGHHRADHFLVRAQHPVCVDDAFGRAGRSRREQDLRDRVSGDGRARIVHRAAGRLRLERGERRRRHGRRG